MATTNAPTTPYRSHSRSTHRSATTTIFFSLLSISSLSKVQMLSPNSHKSVSPAVKTDDETSSFQGPAWDPINQIYVGGNVPAKDEQAVQRVIADNEGGLRLFGYGSLCWNPGNPKTDALADPAVIQSSGRVSGYRRCWAQKSTDHRGVPSFPGIVCTFLRDDELGRSSPVPHSETEGVVFKVPPHLTNRCLEELDFREKGGYARDVIDVLDENGESYQALLYRGTPDNPAFWRRAKEDLPFAAAIMSVSVGPSGSNVEYLRKLDGFLKSISHHVDDDTLQLATMVERLEPYGIFFLLGSGSNQHGQLRLDAETVSLVEDENAHELTEIAVVVETSRNEHDPPTEIFAGGGHSGILSSKGRLYLFGWNESNQLASSGNSSFELPLPCTKPLSDIKVKKCSLGFSHTLVIEKNTGRLFCFGSNEKGQVDPSSPEKKISHPTSPFGDERIVHISAGLFHSSAVTEQGELIVWGLGRGDATQWSKRWRPPDDAKVRHIASGRGYTVVSDSLNRVWSMGSSNKYGQLGRAHSKEKDPFGAPSIVSLDTDGGVVEHIECGWSHAIILVRNREGLLEAFGFGRNDKGQLGTGATEHHYVPARLWERHSLSQVSCGSESSHFVDSNDKIWSCGWNEHGNLALGHFGDTLLPEKVTGAPVSANTAPKSDERLVIKIAAGGGHLLAMCISQRV